MTKKEQFQKAITLINNQILNIQNEEGSLEYQSSNESLLEDDERELLNLRKRLEQELAEMTDV